MPELKVGTLARVFNIKRGDKKAISLSDPNPAMSVEEVVRFYSTQYPELLNAKIPGAAFENDQAVYEFETVVGVNG